MNGGSVRDRLTAVAKARWLAETPKLGVDVAALARRHGVGASSLYAWCHLSRQGASGNAKDRSCRD